LPAPISIPPMNITLRERPAEFLSEVSSLHHPLPCQASHILLDFRCA
jgi:hypothetical protein